MRKNITKRIAYVSVSVILSMIIFFCFSATAYSQSMENGMSADREGLELQEEEIMETIRKVMEDYGCKDSGITMTKVFGEDGARDYEVVINHRNISYMDVSEKVSMEAQLTSMMGQWGDVTFCYKFTTGL